MLAIDTSRHPAAWSAEETRNAESWTIPFSGEAQRAIIAVAKDLCARNVPPGDVEPGLFENAGAANLHQLLCGAADEIMNGRGFVLFRDFPLDRLSSDEAAYGYVAVGRYFGATVAQNPQGDVLGKVMDLAKDWKTDPTARGYQTAMHMDFHSDGCDIVGLLCINPAKSGGLSAVVSSVAVYNHMRTATPELAEVLCQPLYYDRRGEEVAGVAPYHSSPLFNEHHGGMFNRYCREYIESAQRFESVPRLTGEQIEAMNEFDRLCHDPRFILHMDFRRGDIQLLNNHLVLHSRTAFEDHEELDKRRLLWRLYINHRSHAQRPACFESRFADPEKWSLVAMVGR